MNHHSYGQLKQTKIESVSDYHIEQIAILGYTVVKGVLKKQDLSVIREKVYKVYTEQLNELGSEAELEQIQEKNMARALLTYDDYFIKIATEPLILDIATKMIGQKIVLHLQNAIINKPILTHHQTAWHRDLPYQNFVISEPLALSALFVIDDFSAKTGGTMVLPYTHKLKNLPSEEFMKDHALQIVANAGDVVLFDSMLIHRAGHNQSAHDRIAINHVYTAPLIKQQIDLPNLLGEKYNTSELADILGYSTMVAPSVTEWRKNRLNKVIK